MQETKVKKIRYLFNLNLSLHIIDEKHKANLNVLLCFLIWTPVKPNIFHRSDYLAWCSEVLWYYFPGKKRDSLSSSSSSIQSVSTVRINPFACFSCSFRKLMLYKIVLFSSITPLLWRKLPPDIFLTSYPARCFIRGWEFYRQTKPNILPHMQIFSKTAYIPNYRLRFVYTPKWTKLITPNMIWSWTHWKPNLVISNIYRPHA